MTRSRLPKPFSLFSLGTFAILLGLGLASTILARLWRSASEPPSSVLYEKDVTFGTREGTPLLLDLARPKAGTGPFPAVLCLHGGGWRAGDKSEYLQAVFSLAKHGYVAATVNYRFAPCADFPSQLQDVKTAVRYLRSRARGAEHRLEACGGSRRLGGRSPRAFAGYDG